MPRRSTDLFRWLLLVGFLCRSSCQGVSSSAFENKTGPNESKPRVFSPRMDYDEWTPLGRGDPLKNNPTFDYVPPVLDRVQYWLDSHTTEPSAKRDILVLGVTAKKTSPKIPEQFLKFVDGPKFTRTSQDVPFRNDFTGSTGAEPPKVQRTTNFRNGPMDYRNQNRIQSVPASYYPSPYYNQKSKPYTMMLPPPLFQKDKIPSFVEPTRQFSTQTEEGPVLQDSQFYALPSSSYNQRAQTPTKQSQSSSSSPNKGIISHVETIKSVYAPSSPQPTRHEGITTPAVSFQKSNLIYQSTQTVAGGWPGTNGPLSTPTTSIASQYTRQTPDYSHDHYEIDHHVAAGSSNHEVVVQQNANIIVDGDSNENEEVVVGQKGAASQDEATASTIAAPFTDKENAEEESSTVQSSEKMHIVVANSPSSLDAETLKSKNGAVAVVMPANYDRSEKTSILASSSPETSEPSPTAADVSMTTFETEGSGENITKAQPQPVRDSATSSPIHLEDFHSPAPLSPNRIASSHLPHSHPQPLPGPLARHPPSSVHSFGSPPAPLQSIMHQQSRPNHAMMHFLGSMRPSMALRPPGSMSMSPPMAHMHAPPMKLVSNHMGPPMGMDQSYRPPQMQDFLVTHTDSPASSTFTVQTDDRFVDRHRSRAPDPTTLITTPTPFVPTVPSTENPSSPLVADTFGRDSVRVDHSSLGSILNKEKEETSWGTVSSTTARSPTTTTPQRVTTVASLTTDPIFSHYKQPAKPIRGPMYLIIQGHSKVKTYKPTVSKHGMPVGKNDIAESATERQLSKFEQFIKENTKTGNSNSNANANTVAAATATATAEKKKAEEKARAEKLAQARENSLMSLVESGLGSFTVSPFSLATEEEHQANSVTTIELNGN